MVSITTIGNEMRCDHDKRKISMCRTLKIGGLHVDESSRTARGLLRHRSQLSYSLTAGAGKNVQACNWVSHTTKLLKEPLVGRPIARKGDRD